MNIVKQNDLSVSIIIVNYKTTALLVDAIDSVFARTAGVTFEIIVVDNHSEDDSRHLLQKRYGDRIIYLGLTENIGFGRANNAGLELARGHNILFLNPDTVLMNNAVKVLSNYLDNNDTAGACGGNLYDSNLQPAHSLIRRFPSVGTELDSLFGNIPLHLRYGRNWQFNHTGHALKVAYVLGADLMIKRKVLEQVGGFDDRFFMFFEETDLCFRIRKEGWGIASVPEARIQHLEGKSFDGVADERRMRLFEQGRQTFNTIHYPLHYRRLLDRISSLSITFHLILFKFLSHRRYIFWHTKKTIFTQTKKTLHRE